MHIRSSSSSLFLLRDFSAGRSFTVGTLITFLRSLNTGGGYTHNTGGWGGWEYSPSRSNVENCEREIENVAREIFRWTAFFGHFSRSIPEYADEKWHSIGLYSLQSSGLYPPRAIVPLGLLTWFYPSKMIRGEQVLNSPKE